MNAPSPWLLSGRKHVKNLVPCGDVFGRPVFTLHATIRNGLHLLSSTRRY